MSDFTSLKISKETRDSLKRYRDKLENSIIGSISLSVALAVLLSRVDK